MQLLMVLIALIGISLSIANKKNAEKAQKQRQALQGRETAAPAPAAQNRTSPAKTPVAPSKFPPAGPSKSPSAAASKRTANQAQKTQTKTAAPSYGGTPRYTHVVTSTLEGGHTHTESSMTGEEFCPPSQVAAVRSKEEQPACESTGALLDFQANSVLQGVLYAEILGKPKSLQRK